MIIVQSPAASFLLDLRCAAAVDAILVRQKTKNSPEYEASVDFILSLSLSVQGKANERCRLERRDKTGGEFFQGDQHVRPSLKYRP